MKSGELFVENEIIIQASASKIWDILTNPEQTKKYMFGCEALSYWKPDDPLIWKGEWEGEEKIFVTGYIVSIIPNEHLAFTTFDPNNPNIKDIPGNHTTVTYDLYETDNGILLKVKQGDFATVDEGEKRFKETYNNGEGWNPILKEIKKLAEA
jgi:uncharacterized protein YndB with AHSA1/START domain